MENNYGFFATKWYRIMEWIWRLAFLNILWLVFTIAGLGVISVFPATVAVYTVLRKWLIRDPEVAIFTVFWSSFKKDFFKANGLGYILLLIGFVLYFNYNYLAIVSGLEHTLILLFWYISMAIYLLLLFFLFPVYVHYELRFFQYFRTALLIAISNPLSLISIIASLTVGLAVFYFIPGLVPFYFASVLMWLIMWNVTHAFRRTEWKLQRIEDGDDVSWRKYSYKSVKDKIISMRQS
ncbi:YesL family protein [Amphibacillus sediminis]|uniref:YesL family protein n=1 Tax=Amphibacillus sediminis TaxID=360185 RepID=UPI0008312A0C|nr:YesL family protein [Amphibacillus sediminis]